MHFEIPDHGELPHLKHTKTHKPQTNTHTHTFCSDREEERGRSGGVFLVVGFCFSVCFCLCVFLCISLVCSRGRVRLLFLSVFFFFKKKKIFCMSFVPLSCRCVSG